jgi:hypothetical protein
MGRAGRQAGVAWVSANHGPSITGRFPRPRAPPRRTRVHVAGVQFRKAVGGGGGDLVEVLTTTSSKSVVCRQTASGCTAQPVATDTGEECSRISVISWGHGKVVVSSTKQNKESRTGLASRRELAGWFCGFWSLDFGIFIHKLVTLLLPGRRPPT